LQGFASLLCRKAGQKPNPKWSLETFRSFVSRSVGPVRLGSILAGTVQNTAAFLTGSIPGLDPPVQTECALSGGTYVPQGLATRVSVRVCGSGSGGL
jgi:hypothetical protein